MMAKIKELTKLKITATFPLMIKTKTSILSTRIKKKLALIKIKAMLKDKTKKGHSQRQIKKRNLDWLKTNKPKLLKISKIGKK